MVQVSLKASTSGMQYAGWEPRAVATEGLGNQVLAGQRIPVADDVTLNADVYLPKAPGRYPAVVSFAAYSTELHTAGVPDRLERDRLAAGVHRPRLLPGDRRAPWDGPVYRRRRSCSSTRKDVDDHEKVIAWAAEQPWCNGEVVLFGTSYYAMAQPFVATRRPPALKAFFANEMCTDLFRHIVQFGGVPGSFFLGLWMGANFTEAQEQLRLSPERRALLSHLTNGRRTRSWRRSCTRTWSGCSGRS